jgi:hypothetical protein
MFRTDLLSIIRSLDNVFSAIGVCPTIYVDLLLAVNTVTKLLTIDSKSVRNM